MTELNSASNREVDLLDLLIRLGHGIRRLFTSIVNVLKFLFVFGIRRLHWLIIFAMVGGATGILIYKTSEQFYTSEMIAQPNGFSSSDMKVYINDVHEMCKKGNIPGIAKVLNLHEQIAEQIKDIEAFFYIDVNDDGIGDFIDFKNNYDPLDTIQSIISSRILIRAQVHSNNVFPEVKAGLQKYIDNNPYLVTVNTLRQEELKALIAQIDGELIKLDSLQNYEYYRSAREDGLNREGQIVFMNEKETQLYYRDKMSLLSTQIEYRRSLELATKPITILKDFTELEMEENPMSKYTILFGFFGGLLGFVLLLILKFRQAIKDFFKEGN